VGNDHAGGSRNEVDFTYTSEFFLPVALQFFYRQKKRITNKKLPGNDLWKLFAPKKIKKKDPEFPGIITTRPHHSQ
jgi:hypothetical protein